MKLLILLMMSLLITQCGDGQKFASGGDVTNTNQINLKQVERDQHKDAFTQGAQDNQRTQSFTQGEGSGIVDILVVVDNSGSMDEEQENLASKLQPLLSKLEKADWQVAVTTTDPREKCNRALIKSTDSNAESKFYDAINAGTNGSGEEHGLYKAVLGLKGECEKWLRDYSTLAILIVSDEDNCSGDSCDYDNSHDENYLINYLSTIRVPNVDARIYGIIEHPDEECTDASEGYTYANNISRTGGTWGSICDSSYAKTLTQISADIAMVMKNQFVLEAEPLKNTVEVRVDGEPMDIKNYKVRKNKISFYKAPEMGSKIEITYQALKNSSGRTFKLKNPIINQDVKVFVNDKELDPQFYKVDTINKKIIFSMAPGVGSKIRVEYYSGEPLKNQFEIPTGIGSMLIRINSVPTNDYEYDANSGVLTFDPPPPDGAAIAIIY